MPIHDGRRARRELADKLDFVCFLSIVLMYGAGAVLLAAYAGMSLERLNLMVVAVLPLGLWLGVGIVLRRYLEESDRPQEKRYRRQVRETSRALVSPEPTAKAAVVRVVAVGGRA